MFSLLQGISGNFWSEKHIKKSNHWVTVLLSSTKSLNMPTANMPTCQTLFCKDFAQFQKWTGLLFARIFAGWNTDVGISHGISVNFLPVAWETGPPKKTINRRKHWPFEWAFCDLVETEGWTMATCFMPCIKKVTVDAMVSYQKKHLGNNDQFCWWGTLMPSVWTLTSIITTAITSITITFLRFVLVARTSNSEPRWAAGCYSWSWKHLKTAVTVVLVPFYGFHSDHVLSILPALF